jgi:uncharacterized protein (DUF433 family)
LDTTTARRAATEGTVHVVRRPDVLGGEPTVQGTRISVRSIVLAAREYGGAAGALEAYPQLDPQAVRDALAFYAAHREEIDRAIQENALGE